MKTQLTPVFGGLVVGIGGISVTYANGTYTFSLSSGEPTQVAGDTVIPNTTAAIAVVRNNPAVTNLTLPDLTQFTGSRLPIFDWSTNVVNHQIIITPYGGQTIMRAATWSIFSNANELGRLTLTKATSLNGWYI